MLHADLPQHDPEQAHSAARERRRHPRLPCEAEVSIAWNHALDQPVRLNVLNISEGGLKVESTMPIMTEATGIAINLLPEGVPLNRAFKVRWSHRREDGMYFAGLMFLD